MFRRSKRLGLSPHHPSREVSWCWRKQSIEFNTVIKRESRTSNLRRNVLLKGGELWSILHDRLYKQSPGGQCVDTNQLNKELWLCFLSSGWIRNQRGQSWSVSSAGGKFGTFGKFTNSFSPHTKTVFLYKGSQWVRNKVESTCFCFVLFWPFRIYPFTECQ